MEPTAQLIQELEDARETLWRELAPLDDHTEVSSGVTKWGIFAHIAGWEALVFEAFREHVTRVPANRRPYPGIDAMNREFLTQKQGTSAASMKLECEINRFAILTLINMIPESDFEKPVRFLWGEETIIQFFRGAIGHERDHAAEVAEYNRGKIRSA